MHHAIRHSDYGLENSTRDSERENPRAFSCVSRGSYPPSSAPGRGGRRAISSPSLSLSGPGRSLPRCELRAELRSRLSAGPLRVNGSLPRRHESAWATEPTAWPAAWAGAHSSPWSARWRRRRRASRPSGTPRPRAQPRPRWSCRQASRPAHRVATQGEQLCRE